MPASTISNDCESCTRLLSKVEALTFEQARVHNSLYIANLSSDRASARALTLRAYEVNKQRQEAREALEIHRLMHRSESAVATSCAEAYQ